MNKKKLLDLILGQSQSYLIQYKNQLIAKEIYQDFSLLDSYLNKRGFEVKILSGFRSFETQKDIWLKKINGTRDVLDINSKKINISKMSEKELFFSILNWSAFPGLSRHHFGTDLDLVDDLFLRENPLYNVELIDSEYEKGGVFNQFYQCIKSHSEKFNFYFPYQKDLGGIKPEPWHISHVISKEIIHCYEYNIFKELINSEVLKDFPLINIAKKNSKILYQKYFLPIINI